MSDTIQIQFNGESREVPSDSTIRDLLTAAGVKGEYCAVELNMEIVPRQDYESQLVKAGDAIEVVTLVGGG